MEHYTQHCDFYRWGTCCIVSTLHYRQVVETCCLLRPGRRCMAPSAWRHQHLLVSVWPPVSGHQSKKKGCAIVPHCLRVQLQCSATVPKPRQCLGGGYRRRDEPQLQLEGWDGSGVSAAPACLTLIRMVLYYTLFVPLLSLFLLASTHRRQSANIWRQATRGEN